MNPTSQQIGIEIQTLRFTVQMRYPSYDFDANMTFYYDETNNIKKFQFKNGKINQPEERSFILGGVVYEGAAPDISNVFSGIRIDHSANEVKFRDICSKGQFQDCLKSSKLTPLLKHVLNENLYLHLSVFNIFYNSLTDIVDTLAIDYPFGDDYNENCLHELKSILYQIAILQKDEVLSLLYKYNYPNVPPAKCSDFVNDLLEIVNQYSLNNPELDNRAQLLKDILVFGASKSELLYLQGLQSHVLIESLVGPYRRQVIMFINSEHHFDREGDIETEMASRKLTFNGNELRNVHFHDSMSNQFTQLSDVLIGLIGQVSNFINSHTLNQINTELSSLSQVQMANLVQLQQLAEKSYQQNKTFFHFSEGTDNKQKWFKVLLPNIDLSDFY